MAANNASTLFFYVQAYTYPVAPSVRDAQPVLLMALPDRADASVLLEVLALITYVWHAHLRLILTFGSCQSDRLLRVVSISVGRPLERHSRGVLKTDLHT